MYEHLLISCEHGGNEIPYSLKQKVKIPVKILNSHRGLDIGALEIAQSLGRKFKIPVHTNLMSRLIIEYNRSLHHPKLFSEYTKALDVKTKENLIKEYVAYRDKILKAWKPRTLHLSIHSFTPVMNGEVRNCDFGILYDPAREKEKAFARELKIKLNGKGIKARLNYPYLGKSDGLTTYLRKHLGKSYAGLELEFNQNLVFNTAKVKLILDEIKNSIR